MLQTDDNDPPDSDLYNPAAMKYAGAANVYLMFPSLYQHDPDTLDIRLAVSRDGVHWTWPQQDVAFIPLGRAGCIRQQNALHGAGHAGGRRRNVAVLFRFSSDAQRPRFGRPSQGRAATGLQPRGIRRDRFVSADSGPEGGYFVTPPLRFAGNVLDVNVDVRPGGRIRVALLAENGEPVPGYTVNDCLPISGDQLAEPVRWRQGGDVTSLAGKPTRLRVELASASLYAFHFTVDHAGEGRDH